MSFQFFIILIIKKAEVVPTRMNFDGTRKDTLQPSWSELGWSEPNSLRGHRKGRRRRRGGTVVPLSLLWTHSTFIKTGTSRGLS